MNNNLLIGFSTVFIWYYFQINFYGEKFIEVHFFQQNFDRLSTAVEGNKGEVWYYILELAKYSFPWLIFFPGGLIVAWKKRQKNLIKLIATGFFLFLFIITILTLSFLRISRIPVSLPGQLPHL